MSQQERFNKRLATDDTSDYKVVRRFDISFNPYLLWAGAVAQNWDWDEAIISPVYPTFRVRPGYEPRFIDRLLRSPRMIARYDSIAFGSVPRRRRTSIEDFLALEIPEPPLLDDQRRIADILDRADAIRRKRKEAIALTEQLLRSTFLEMFGDPVTNPKGWPQLTLEDAGEVATGATPNRSIAEYYEGDIPWVKTGEVNWNTILETEEHITQRALRETNCKIFPPGSLLIAMYGQGATRGKCALLGVPAATNQACAVVLPNGTCAREFLFEQIRLSYARLRDLARGGNQANLNLSLVRSLPFIIPPRPLQDQFALCFAQVSQTAEWQQEAQSEAEHLFEVLVSHAFRDRTDSELVEC